MAIEGEIEEEEEEVKGHRVERAKRTNVGNNVCTSTYTI
jgi:hypothetical protein